MRSLWMAIVLSALAAACGAGSSSLAIRLGDRQITLEPKAAGTYKNVKTSPEPDGSFTKAVALDIYIANYDMDTRDPLAMRKFITAPEQVRLQMQLVGEEGTDQTSEFKPGIYRADGDAKFMKLEWLHIATLTDGREALNRFATMTTAHTTSNITGQVEITSITPETLTGTIDVIDGDRSVKGPFTATITPVR